MAVEMMIKSRVNAIEMENLLRFLVLFDERSFLVLEIRENI